MNEPKRGQAQMVAWKSPENQAISLVPVYEKGGRLEVELHNGAVTMRGKQCRYSWTDNQHPGQSVHKMLDDVDITVALVACQINWKFTENQTESKMRLSNPSL
jgi:hypothetical protein